MLREMVRRHAMAGPHRCAVVAEDRRLTYAELDDAATAVSAALAGQGIGSGSLVALHVPRTADALVAIVGVLGAGAAYTIVEDDGNRTENRARLEAIGADLVLTGEDLRALPAGRPAAGDLPAPEPGDAAYVLFTSGSTGTPKGVIVTHGNVRHYVTSLLSRLEIAEPLSYAAVSTLSADLGNTCLFLPLWSGGTVHLVGDDVRKDPSAVLGYLERERVDVLKITPSHWDAILRALRPGTVPGHRLRFLILGGEALRRELAVRTLGSGVTRTLVNHYGPTEATVGVAAHVMTDPADAELPGAGSVPVGTPLGSTRLLVHTADGEYADRGVGELLIGGPSVAAGYRGDPGATEAAFVTGVADGRFYRTGDIVEITGGGVTVFLGRTDRQVKIDGYRVELEQIESVARTACDAPDAAALYLPLLGRHRLVLVVARCTDDQAAAARARLSDRLPAYMVPWRVIPHPGDFPRNANGKVDHGAIREFVEALPDSGDGPEPSGGDDPLAAEVRRAWRSCLHHHRFDDDTDFFAAGGGSLDALRLIADLQSSGHPITARAFLDRPTVAATCQAIRAAGRDRARDRSGAPENGGAWRGFSAAQEAFFGQEHARPDHYNQALLLEAATAVDAAALRAAAADVARPHPLLRTAYRRHAQGWRAEPAEPGTDPFSTSTPASASADGLADHVRRTAQNLHAAIDLAGGEVFKVHLFTPPGGRDLILLICHHLCVDAVSWRILVSDLVSAYRARLAGTEPRLVPPLTTFWDWAAHVTEHSEDLAREFGTWWDGIAAPPLPALPTADGAAEPREDLEQDASTAWLALSHEETELVRRELPARTGAPLHAAVLGAFVHSVASARGSAGSVVDVESHGRAVFDTDLDVSRVVGWFTSTFPVPVRAVAGDVAATVKETAAALSSVPDLGIGHGLAGGRAPGARICYNFVGEFRFEFDDVLALEPSRLAIGPARGGPNDRGHAWKLTARIVHGRLVIDLSFNSRHDAPAAITAALRRTAAHLSLMAGIAEPATSRVLVRPGSASGMLAYAPAELSLTPPGRASERGYRNVLLTGATGFIGAHLLHLLLTRTGARVHCVIRGDDGARSAERLRETYRWYFPGRDLGAWRDRLAVHRGDVTRTGLGLPAEVYERLCGEVDAVYHLAGDTRLLGDPQEFERVNVDSVRAVIELARTGRPKDLHHMSTLAVAGTNHLSEQARFAESDFDIGQEFRNPYERSKYLGERLVREFIREGGPGFIYRVGNTSGHSQTGRFQRNAHQNRLVQELRAVALTGRLPRRIDEKIALCPVDEVAEAVLAISLSTKVSCGTFHVDTAHEVAYADFLAEMARLGYSFERTDADSIADALVKYGDQADPSIALGTFWATRASPNVRLDHSRTQALLADLGLAFTAPDGAWLRALIRHLVEEGHL